MNNKYVKFALIAFVLWYVVSRPEAAARMVRAATGALGNAAESLSQFVNALG